jgi:hypothetical protein
MNIFRIYFNAMFPGGINSKINTCPFGLQLFLRLPASYQ